VRQERKQHEHRVDVVGRDLGQRRDVSSEWPVGGPPPEHHSHVVGLGDLRGLVAAADHVPVHAIDADAGLLGKTELADHLGQKPVPRLRRMSEDILDRHAETSEPGESTTSRVGACSTEIGSGNRQSPVGHSVRECLTHRSLGQVGQMYLLSRGQ